MARLEYCLIMWLIDIDRGYLSFLSNLQNSEITDFENLAKTITQLGLEGWEMVSHISTHVSLGSIRDKSDAEAFYFKRQINEDNGDLHV